MSIKPSALPLIIICIAFLTGSLYAEEDVSKIFDESLLGTSQLHDKPVRTDTSIDETDRVRVSERLHREPGEQYYFPPVYPQSAPSQIPAFEEVNVDDKLTQDAKDAMEKLPNWLKADFAHNFSYLSPAKQDQYAGILLNNTQPEITDELGFQMARIPAKYLGGNKLSPELLVDNAQLLYEIDPYLKYADLVDVGFADLNQDYYTTVQYWLDENGTITTYELPKEIYYWYIVHPKLSDESPMLISPVTGDFMPSGMGGVHWRRYFWYDHLDREKKYVEHYLMRTPDLYDLDRFDNWGASSYGYLKDASVAPNVMLYTDNPDKPTLMEFPYGKGLIIATMMPMEKAYQDGTSDFAERLVTYGNVDVTLRPRAPVMIIKDVDPYGSPTVEDILSDAGFADVNITHSNEIGIKDLSRYHKVIVPSMQPFALYEAISDNKEWIQDWVRNGGVFELHGATTPSADWSGLEMPGGFTSVPQHANEINDITVGGHPFMPDIMTHPEVMWDRKPHNLSGDRYFDFNTNALDLIGNFITKNMIQNIVERAQTNYGDYERSVQPVRIIYNHYGNCGELQDVLNAACRTCLIPNRAANNPCEDHVWNMFFERSWHTFEVWWSSSNSRIALPGGRFDEEYGGGYHVPAIWSMRSDFWPVNSTPFYTDTCTLQVTVHDANDNPVDCAKVIVLTDYLHGGLYNTIYGYTDSLGKVAFELGEERDYHLRVFSRKLGPYANDPVHVIADAQVDYTYDWNCNLSDATPELKLNELPLPPGPGIGEDLIISYNCPYEVQVSQPSDAYENNPGGHIDFFIVDEDNYNKYINDENFGAFMFQQFDTNNSVGFALPTVDTWYMVFSNEFSEEMKQVISFTATVMNWQRPDMNAVFTRTVAIPAGDHYALRHAVDTSQPPQVMLGGYMSTDISALGGGDMVLLAYISDPDGLEDVAEVQIFSNGLPLGVKMWDTGTMGDFGAGDGFYGFKTYFVPGSRSGQFLMGVGVDDKHGWTSLMWPYLEVK